MPGSQSGSVPSPGSHQAFCSTGLCVVAAPFPALASAVPSEDNLSLTPQCPEFYGTPRPLESVQGLCWAVAGLQRLGGQGWGGCWLCVLPSAGSISWNLPATPAPRDFLDLHAGPHTAWALHTTLTLSPTSPTSLLPSIPRTLAIPQPPQTHLYPRTFAPAVSSILLEISKSSVFSSQLLGDGLPDHHLE